MAYIGKTPASAALTSSDISDGIISTAKIADDAATADKIANAVNSAITANTAKTGISSAQTSAITANTSKTTNATHSGEVTGSGALTIADNVVDEANLKVSNSAVNGYVLTARSGNNGQMTWEEAGGGEWTKILHTTANNDGSVIFNSTYITSTYQDYRVVWSNVHTTNDNQNFSLIVSADNGSNAVNTDNAIKLYKDDGNNTFRSETDVNPFRLHGNETAGNDAGISIAGSLEMFDPSATDTRTHFLGRSVSNIGDSAFAHFHSLIGGSTLATTAVNYIKFLWLAGNIASGEFTLYGRKI